MLKVIREYSSIILSFRVTRFEQFGHFFRFRAELTLMDGSKLYVRETVMGKEKRRYAYHWQDKEGELLVRWDNAPGWDIDTYPHHKHVGREDKVEASYERSLDKALEFIASRIEPRTSGSGKE